MYPLAKIGVSGKLHDVCNLLSSLGLCADLFGNPLHPGRLFDDELFADSDGTEWLGGDREDGIGKEPFLYDLLQQASIERDSDRHFKEFIEIACGGTAGARVSLRYEWSVTVLFLWDMFVPCETVSFSLFGDAGRGGNASLSGSGLVCGESGKGPK